MGAFWTRYPVVQACREKPRREGVAARTPNRHWWSGREYQGDRANPGQGTRQITPCLRYKETLGVKEACLGGALGVAQTRG